MSDTMSKGAGKFAQVSLVPSDVVGRVFTGARSISDNSVSVISDSVTKVFHGFRSTSESLASAIAAIVNKGLVKSLSEAPPISGTTSRLFAGFRGLAESPTLSDAIARLFHGVRSLSETPTISDAASRVFTGFRTTSENLASTISDVVRKGAVKSLSEVVSITDSVSKGAGWLALESLVPSDVVGRVFTGFRTLTENPTASDSASRVFTGFRTTSESLASTISDVVRK